MAAVTGGPVLSPSEERGCRKLSSIFDIPPSKRCHRCGETVYHAEKIGPVKDVVFHRPCFKCCVCGQHLTIKNYASNQVDSRDKEVYCQAHATRLAGKGLDDTAMGIRGAVNSQNMYRRATATDLTHSAPLMDSRALGIKRALSTPKVPGQYNEQIHGTRRGPHIDTNALYIRVALNAQGLRGSEKFAADASYQYPAIINKKRQEILDAQKQLEEELRKEEDHMYDKFKGERGEEKKKLEKEFDTEWEIKLKDLTEKFERDHGKKMKKMKDNERKAMTMRLDAEKSQLEESLAAKKKKQQQFMTLKIIEKEQEMTTEMLKKHSEQMLSLLAEKQLKARIEVEQELMRAREQEIKENGNAETAEDIAPEKAEELMQENLILQEALESLAPVAAPTEVPDPKPPIFRKIDMYQDPVVFKDLDEYVFGIAEADHNSWTDLVKQLVAPCLSDLEKVRAIFRWITVKDLNVMEFDETADSDTPLGILRGIKYGTETYHVLFMRMCSYAGLHCTEIKGKSKSVGYEPGMKFKEDLFNNTWNAVLIDGEWRLIQCNWGARHLVLNKDGAGSSSADKKRKDKIRYQYDEHYFMTDPDEFILEFMAAEPQWQLLERPITIEEFQQLPFVRSVFFHYGMKFMESPRAVIRTNSKGGAEIKIRVPSQHIQDVVFHYQLRFADKEKRHDTDYKGAKLERFVFQTMLDDHVIYSIHVPTSGEYFLEIFANKIDDSHRVGDDPNAPMMPFRLKCACKFRIICENLQNKMHPLPSCAAGEWGPTKSIRHFDLIPISNKVGVISPQTDKIDIRFKVPRPLHFLAKLRKNGIDEHALDRFVEVSIHGEELRVSVIFPEPGQYGLDLYARPEAATDSQTLAHACKYLINMEKVSQQIELDVMKVDSATLMSKDKWGALPQFEKFGMKALSHKDPKIRVSESNQLTIEIALSERVQISYHLIRDPDEDHREHVTVARLDDGRRAKFFVNLLRPGHYLLALYAKQDLDTSKKMVNVFNYMIKYDGQGPHHMPQDTPKKKSGIFGKK